ncbi:hypothetical protein LTR78_008029 [Recurvomyces mirabilis]|uniref:Very-long-chain 3-oxoacyl-CoA reductase n=1 Tax=Recurvomyces mirabilis TaxID=574656 RepID=A0AAE0WHU8_9PEZI|nr:hypothetical protein LTR78_008029 [Recurvomyces mirabilis]KAK5150757.1 hypothetical protein LTS14_009820 [Recurvomyces mirabilis]
MADSAQRAMNNVAETDYWASPTTQVFAFIGLLYITLKIFSFWRLIASLFILPGTNLSTFGKKGTWAVITGASDGIGKEYALQLSKKGFNVLLISRTQSKLDSLATEIKSTHNVDVQTLSMDFAANNDVDYANLQSILQGLDVSILINNVGLSHNIPVPFAETPEKEMRDIITINCTATLRVTRLIAPAMIQRHKGLILTMASFGGILPTPLLATYSGSKSFLQHWSSALASELAPHGVTVQLVQSYLVTSAMSKIRRSSMLVPTPKQFVRAALGKVGRSGGAQGVSATSTPYWAHGVMHWGLSTLTPGVMNRWVIGVNKGMHEGIRKRAERKAEREKGKKSA